ncbi:hypothetical protein BJV74DRAFT_837337 [Russula compacta]|nr:hypothetical protein BJV74DRAFT_837337 [Russula compacta]
MDGSEFGRYGVLRFMRRHEETVVASYPIDDEELTFGCDSSCSVRLYYPTVSPLHAKIIFQERKAFIEVLGVHGLLVDNCQVFPASMTTHTTVPLTNNSEVEISKKRFRFEYPPKALRPVLTFTPPPQASGSARKRVLRLSMIQSAQVFTPRPDPDPRVNLPPSGLQDEGYGTPIRLVEGNRPQVVEEEQDLVILEEFDAPEHIPLANPVGFKSEVGPSGFINPMQSPLHASQMGGPHPAPGFPLPPSHQMQQFQTPRRRPGRPSLHRAVLIRSAQRAVMRVEMEREQEQEEREVEEHVLPIEEQMEIDAEDQGDQDALTEELDDGTHEFGEDEDSKPGPEPTTPIFGWRTGLEAFKTGLPAFRSRSKSPEKSPEKNEHATGDVAEARTSGSEYDTHYSLHDDGDQFDHDGELRELQEEEDLGDVLPGHGVEVKSEIGARAFSVPRQFTPQRPPRPLPFMTPQVPKANKSVSLVDRVRGRKSTGGVGQASLARKWEVKEVAVQDADQSTPRENAGLGQQGVTDSERQAIQERRRSALAQPDIFFGGSIPGSRRTSLGSGTPGAKVVSNFASPSKAYAAIKEEDEEAETTVLLEKMKEVVEGMQRRRSMQPEAVGNIVVFNRSEEGDTDAGQQDETPEDEEASNKEPVPPQADSRSAKRSFPATPHMSDLKHVFSEKRAENMPPSYVGIRVLFKAEDTPNLESPRLDGVREMFFRAREREPSTPTFEGVGEMFAASPGYIAQEATQGNEVEMESTAEAHVSHSALSAKRPRGKSTASDHPTKPGSRVTAKTPSVPPMGDGRAAPIDAEQPADDEQTSDFPPAKPSKQNANAPKGSIVRVTNRGADDEAKEDKAVATTKLASKPRKVIIPELPEHPPTQLNPVAPDSGPARRSRAATKSNESTTESEPTKANKSTRKMARGTKARGAPTAGPEPDAEAEAESAKGPRRGAKKRSQSVEVAPAPAPPATKRRVGAKSKKTGAAAQGPPTEDDLPLGAAEQTEPSEAPTAARGRRGKTKKGIETEDESVGALRVARGKRTPTGTAAAGTASNRGTAGKGRAGAAASSAKSAARMVVEKENTPEPIRVKEEEDEKMLLPLPPVATKGARARKIAAAAVAPKAQSEPEKDTTTTAKTRAPRTRAASGRK